MKLDYKKIKFFWDLRSERLFDGDSFSITNLEEDKALQKKKLKLEYKKINNFISPSKNYKVLDLGAGLGYWSTYFAKRCRSVVAVDYSQKMIEKSKKNAMDAGIQNIDYIVDDVVRYKSNEIFNLIFISGVLIYIDDRKIHPLLNNINNYSEQGTYLLLRDGTGRTKPHSIIGKHSEQLNAEYNAYYRTRRNYIEIFNQIGFKLINDDDMFNDSSGLNKWPETILRIYLFRKQ